MKTVDYNAIASTYDSLAIRNQIPLEDTLGDLLEVRRSRLTRVLDVGCGTGTWLASQARVFASHTQVEWHGVDPNEAMLSRARSKAPFARLALASAEHLPYPGEHFAFVISRFAYHHFADRGRAFDEMRRVLERGGTLRLTNLSPTAMPGWWLFHWFPEARQLNAKYPDVTALRAEIAGRGFDVSDEVRITRGEIPLAVALEQALVRDQSHLAMIDDEAWQCGVDELRAALARSPDATTPTETALVQIHAIRDSRR